MKTAVAPILFAGSTLHEYRHVCAFFNTPDDEYRTMLPFIREGLANGERAFHVIDPEQQTTHMERLRAAGVDVDAAQSTRQLEVLTPQETYLRGGHFDKEAMLALIQEALSDGSAMGFPLTRLMAHAECVLDDSQGANDWIEYETRLNFVLPRFRDPVICTYDCNKLGAGIAMDILRTHPVVVIGNVLQENPFFVPPAQFLRELEERRSAGAGQPSRGSH